MGGGHKTIRYNRDIEEWNAYRENTHRFFTFNRRNLPWLAVFAGAIPYGLYRWVRREQRMQDEASKTSHDYM